MFKWLNNIFKDNRCKCRGCEVARKGWGYAPCSNAKGVEVIAHQSTPTKQPPGKP